MFTVDLMNDKEWQAAIESDNFRTIAYGAGRDWIESITGEEKNACAAVHSAALILRGLFDKLCRNTDQVHQECLRLGMVKFTSWETIRVGDTLFAEDDNNNGIPDHVFLAASVPDSKGFLDVFDNYGAKTYRRNLLKGKYTAFMFGMRYFEFGIIPLSGLSALVSKHGFSMLYSATVWSRLPMGVKRQINRIRGNPVFSNLK